MLKRQRIDININHERWLVSYADFVTLLFAFFVVMYSVSQVNESKYEALSNGLTEVFSITPLFEKKTNNAKSSDPSTAIDALINNGTTTRRIAELPELADQLKTSLADLIDEETIQISSNELWLQISLNNRILFSTASVKPSLQAESIFKEIAAILQDVDNPIQVEGFTDNVAINTSQFPSNWELSTARASSIVQLLIKNNIVPTRLSAVGYAQYQPVADNTSEEGRAQNRRVVLMVGKQATQRPKITPSTIPPYTGDLPEEKMDKPIIQTTDSQSSVIVPINKANRIEPITLKNGELLFTNEPDLKRKER
jgi:chemotaxis protein MotB